MAKIEEVKDWSIKIGDNKILLIELKLLEVLNSNIKYILRIFTKHDEEEKTIFTFSAVDKSNEIDKSSFKKFMLGLNDYIVSEDHHFSFAPVQIIPQFKFGIHFLRAYDQHMVLIDDRISVSLHVYGASMPNEALVPPSCQMNFSITSRLDKLARFHDELKEEYDNLMAG